MRTAMLHPARGHGAAPMRRALRVRGPGLGWLPAVWRRRATWRTVGRFALYGPFIGGAPYVIFMVTIPFIYIAGLLPALLAGLLFATWYHGSNGRTPTWPWRAAVGLLCGAAPAVVAVFLATATQDSPDGFMAGFIAVHGVPAAVVLALTERATVT